MPISGLVLTLSQYEADRASALAALRDHPALALGAAAAHRLPVVADTPDCVEDQALWDWLHALPGVLFVDLVCTDSTADEAPAKERTVQSGAGRMASDGAGVSVQRPARRGERS